MVATKKRTDTLTAEQRARCMAAIRGRDTTPELVVRRLLTSLGYRYRLHVKDLPGRPDIVLSSRDTVILVHGCFWHRHSCPAGRPVPGTRTAFWVDKFECNVRRDRRTQRELRALGWRVLTVWECQTKHARLPALGRRLVRLLGDA